MASHLLDEVEKICTHVTILKTGKILATGAVEEVLSDEDTVEISGADLGSLKAALEGYPGLQQLRQEDRSLVLSFDKGMADTAALNRYCFEKGLVLGQLILRRKKLETRFFELTNN
jgi:ABC-2 type transport system ATP-binding protein